MDMQDKQFDAWIRKSLEDEVPLNRQAKQAAWEIIRFQACLLETHSQSVLVGLPTSTNSPTSLVTRLVNEVVHFFTQENTFQKARAKTIQRYNPYSSYYGCANLHSMELMRQRWAFPV